MYVSVRKSGLTDFVWNVGVPASTLASRSCDTFEVIKTSWALRPAWELSAVLDSSNLQREFLTSLAECVCVCACVAVPAQVEQKCAKYLFYTNLCSVRFSSFSQSCLTHCNHMDCSTPGSPARHQLLELNQTYSIESGMPSNHFILCHPLLLLPAIFPSIRVFPNESVLPIRWPEYLSFSFSISPSGEYSGLISFRMVWLDLLAVQGTLSTVFSNTTLQSVSSLVLSFLYSPTLTSLHDYWKNHSFAYTDHCWQSNVSAF